MANDNVNSPEHYKVGGVETIDLIEAKDLNFNLGNVIKYIARCGHKKSQSLDDNTKALEDLKKAQWYLNREIERRSK